VTAAVNWPVTIGDTNIGFLLPEYWRASTGDDLKLLRALARPEGVLQRMEAKLGPFVDGYTDTLDSDRIRTRFALALMEQHKPGFMAVHLIALDGKQHAEGPWVSSAYGTLEALDEMIGELSAAARHANPDSVIAIVSDHGFIATHTAVNLRKSFVDAGLIQLHRPTPAHSAATIASWDAQLWSGAGVAAVVVRDSNDAKLRRKVSKLLAELKSDSANGISRVLEQETIERDGAFPGAHWLVEFAPGFYLGSALEGELRTPATSKGTHGYLPDRPEMHAAFFIRGAGVAAGKNLGIVDMRQIAPTLAQILGVQLSAAREPVLPIQ
ncbi:MAG TPA: alkaline phosphatase family protein, partial [Nitrospiraceae bacterium]|nr:alkaline phosphatase family protein [Nitrospiraceae bacterium]